MKSNGLPLSGRELINKMSSLTEVRRGEWVIFYLEDNGVKWCKHWPIIEYHGGGAPELKQIESFPVGIQRIA